MHWLKEYGTGETLKSINAQLDGLNKQKICPVRRLVYNAR